MQGFLRSKAEACPTPPSPYLPKWGSRVKLRKLLSPSPTMTADP